MKAGLSSCPLSLCPSQTEQQQWEEKQRWGGGQQTEEGFKEPVQGWPAREPRGAAQEQGQAHGRGRPRPTPHNLDPAPLGEALAEPDALTPGSPLGWRPGKAWMLGLSGQTGAGKELIVKIPGGWGPGKGWHHHIGASAWGTGQRTSPNAVPDLGPRRLAGGQ